MVRRIARVVNLVMTGTLTGNEIGSLVTVHYAVEELPPPVNIEAERAITRRYGQVMPAFMSTTIASFLPVLALHRDRRSASFGLSLAGMGCFVAMLAITLTRNVPLNRRLLAMTEQTPSEEFADVRRQWTRLHVIRNGLNLTGLVLSILAALSGRRA